MTISFSSFLSQLLSSPVLTITVVLTLGVILVNGWTDAPNAIATCVSTRAIGPKAAILMAAFFNFLGVFVMTMLNASVASTIYNMVDFGGNPEQALTALCAALVAIVSWAAAAWWFGIPTSESHALIAGLSGAAVAMHNSFVGINGSEWIKVIYGLILSTLLGFLLGFLSAKTVETVCQNMDRPKTTCFFGGAQIAGGAAMAFMHGAQDGQINHLDENGDRLYTEAMHRLYSESGDAVEILSWTAIYDRLEKCCDKCEDVADVVETVILKYS